MSTRVVRCLAFIAMACVVSASPAAAQVDFSGEWAPRFWEDHPSACLVLSLVTTWASPSATPRGYAPNRGTPQFRRCLNGNAGLTRPTTSGADPRHLRSRRKWIPCRARSWRSMPSGFARSTVPFTLTGDRILPLTCCYTWGGFSTAKWDGDILTVTVTHLKEGYLRRNGLPRSDKATLTEHWIRNGDFLTVVTIVTDPVYLTEPFTDHRL